MTAIRMIPIAKIHVLNPRARGKTKFNDIVANIAALGLKKPITVSPRDEKSDTFDLVCGQGRLEAFQALGQEEIPAIVRSVPRHDRYIMSLVENIARCHPRSMDLVREVRALRDRGYVHADIAAKVHVSESYVSVLLRLVDHGEERLLRAVEMGEIPIAVAAEIAIADDASIQESLAEAYRTKQLRGKALIAARRLVEERKTRGKAMLRHDSPRRKSKVTTDELMRRHRKEVQRQRRIAKKARLTEIRLVFVSNALKQLFGDEHFVTLLRAEKLDNLPEYLAEAMRRAS